MPDNILKKTLAVTCGDFLKEVYGERSKPKWTALTTLFPEVVAGRSTLVSDLSGPLLRDSSRAERKRAQERVSGWLSRYDFAAGAGEWLPRNVPETGRDGSTGDLRMGHDFVCVSLVGAAYREVLPVYARLGRGRRGHGGMLEGAVAAVMVRTGSRRAQVRWKRGTVRHCEDPGSKDAPTRRACDSSPDGRAGGRGRTRGRCCWRGSEGFAAAGGLGKGRARMLGAAAEPCAPSRNRAENAPFARFGPCAQKVPGAFRGCRKYFSPSIYWGRTGNRDKMSRKNLDKGEETTPLEFV